MKLLPYNILIEKIIPEHKNASGLFMPISEQKQFTGTILMRGDDVNDKFEVGAKVKYPQGSGKPFNFEDKDCLILDTRAHKGEIQFL